MGIQRRILWIYQAALLLVSNECFLLHRPMLAFAPTSGYRASPGANALVRVAAARNRLALGLCRSRSGLRSVTWYEERAIRGTRQDYSYRRWRFPYPPKLAWERSARFWYPCSLAVCCVVDRQGSS